MHTFIDWLPVGDTWKMTTFPGPTGILWFTSSRMHCTNIVKTHYVQAVVPCGWVCRGVSCYLISPKAIGVWSTRRTSRSIHKHTRHSSNFRGGSWCNLFQRDQKIFWKPQENKPISSTKLVLHLPLTCP